jgi:hypothetical protein
VAVSDFLAHDQQEEQDNGFIDVEAFDEAPIDEK